MLPTQRLATFFGLKDGLRECGQCTLSCRALMYAAQGGLVGMNRGRRGGKGMQTENKTPKNTEMPFKMPFALLAFFATRTPNVSPVEDIASTGIARAVVSHMDRPACQAAGKRSIC